MCWRFSLFSWCHESRAAERRGFVGGMPCRKTGVRQAARDAAVSRREPDTDCRREQGHPKGRLVTNLARASR